MARLLYSDLCCNSGSSQIKCVALSVKASGRSGGLFTSPSWRVNSYVMIGGETFFFFFFLSSAEWLFDLSEMIHHVNCLRFSFWNLPKGAV